ncbi:MAG: DUF5110 domain-containing protein, partial [Lapillicoccus sp.]
GDLTYETIAAFLRLRYRLLPYLYSLNGWTTHRAYTPMRLLAFDFRHDPAGYDVADQFMLGPALLVCPVTEPMYHGPDSRPLIDVPRSRSVYLPDGSEWYDFWTGERHTGGQRIEVAAPLERIPLFVRAGSILPLGPEVESTDEQPFGPLEVRVYPGADARHDLYDDAGDGYAYERGEFSFTPLLWDEATRTLTVGAREGGFAQMPRTRVIAPVVVARGLGLGGAVTPSPAPLHYGGVEATWKEVGLREGDTRLA